MNEPIRRRSFLLALGAAGGAQLVRRLQPWRVLVAVDPVPAAARLAGLVRAPESAASIGEWYLHHVPDEASADQLTAAIAAGLPGGLTGTDAHLRNALADRVRDEFAAGDVVQLDGWIVARTEARLCALCAVR